MAKFINSARSGFMGFFSSIWALRVHGETQLLTDRVTRELAVFGIALTAFFLVESWAWGRFWSYGLPDSGIWPWVLGGIFGLGAALFDRSLMVADTRGKSNTGMFVVRALLLIAISFITAIPVEVAVFQPEVDQRFDRKALVAQNIMRDRALKAVDEKYDGLIAEAQALKTAGGGEAVAKVQADLDQYTTDRVAARQAITDRLATKEVDIALEAAGKGASGKYGDGPAVKVMRKQVEEIRGELAAFDSETQAKLTELRGTRDASIASTASSLETKIDGLRAQQASEQERVRKMSAKELADEYLVQPGESWTKTDKGGTTTSESKYLIQDDWNPARGFLARFRELREIESDAHKAMVQDLKARGEEEKWYDITTESLIIWMVRLAMVALGLFILMLKILSSEETRTYFHFGSQVADGQSPKVNQMASVMGHHDADGRRMMGLTPKNRALHEGLSEARRQVVEVVGKFRNRLISLCRANEAGLYPTRVVLQSQLRDFWEQFVAPKMNDLDRAEEKMRLSGLIVHAWPEDLGNGQDPRQVKEPWLVLTRELIELGWEDPQPKLEAGKHGLVRIQELRRGIEDTMLSMESELIQAIVNRPSMPEMELRRVLEPLRHGMYEAEVVPRVRALEESTKAAEAVGLKVPAWSQRPRDLAMCWRLPDPTTLREYGWMDGTAGLTQLAPEVTQPFGTTSS